IHDWAEHNPWVAHRPQRVAKARAAAGVRWQKGKRVANEIEPNAVSMQGACPEHNLAIPTSPHLTSKSETHPNPPFQGVSFSKTGGLTVRQVRQLNGEIYESMRDPKVDFETAMKTACARLLI